MVKKVALAYSGGLDTSVCIPILKEKYGYDEVITISVDVGQPEEEIKKADVKAQKISNKHYTIDAKEEFVKDYIFPLIKANGNYEGYVMGTSVARPLIARKVVEAAIKEGATALAHGCTGKGNDQVRFELTFKALMPEVKIIAPWREWSIKSREDAMDYAKQYGIPVPVTKAKPYSSDANLWHISYEGGILEDPANEYDESMFQMTVSPQKAPNKPTYVTIGFDKGIPVSVNGKKYGPVELVQLLNKIAGANGIGRIDIVENRLVGMKSRGVYEAPAATVLYAAHRELESLTLDKETLHYKELIAPKYAEMVYNGQWFVPLREAFDAFINETQKNVTGTVKLKLYKGNIIIAGRKSPKSLYWEKLATFGEDEIYNQKDAEGFINLFGLPLKVKAILDKQR